MKHSTVRSCAAALVCALAMLVMCALVRAQEQPATPTTAPTAIAPEADRLFHATSDLLAQAKSVSFKVEVWDDQVIGKHKISTTRLVQVQLRRPDRMHVEVQSPKKTRGFWYDGKSVTVLDRVKNLYGVMDVPPTIDEMVDALRDRFGVELPLEDVILSDPYAAAMPVVRGGAYLGKVTILGTPCNHIAFGTPAADCQLWIEDGARPLLRKFVITYRNEELSPQFTAIFSDWELGPTIPDETFAFTPPQGAAKIDVLPAKPEAAEAKVASEQVGPSTRSAQP